MNLIYNILLVLLGLLIAFLSTLGPTIDNKKTGIKKITNIGKFFFISILLTFIIGTNKELSSNKADFKKENSNLETHDNVVCNKK